jgi:hypothetical protein
VCRRVPHSSLFSSSLRPTEIWKRKLIFRVVASLNKFTCIPYVKSKFYIVIKILPLRILRTVYANNGPIAAASDLRGSFRILFVAGDDTGWLQIYDFKRIRTLLFSGYIVILR